MAAFPNLGLMAHKPAEWGAPPRSALGPRALRAASPHLGQREVVAAGRRGDAFMRHGGQASSTASGREARAAQRPLPQEVRWRLFPARGPTRPAPRRPERLEETAFGREPEDRPATHDEGKPASSIVPWLGTWSSPAAGSAASTPRRLERTMPRQGARITLVNDVKFPCSTPRSCPRRRPGRRSHATSSLPLRDARSDTSAPGSRGRARRGTAHGDAAGSGGLRDSRRYDRLVVAHGSVSRVLPIPGWPTMRSGSRASPTPSG